jgi:SAM-dependent methyltransferase
MLLSFLRHPLTRDLDLNDPRATVFRKRIIREKRFLRRVYQEWYQWIAGELTGTEGPVLEIGSGGGFLKEYVPGIITSEVFQISGVDVVLDGCVLPFAPACLKAIVMVDVFHHLPDAQAFLSEAQRCLRPGGKVIMVEPWITPWSRLIYRRVHHEPLDQHAVDWAFSRTGPLSGANIALPWIVFHRDRRKFERLFAGLAIEQIEVEMPFRYLLSGGVSLRPLMPGVLYWFWARLEQWLSPFNGTIGMFSRIVVRSVPAAVHRGEASEGHSG